MPVRPLTPLLVIRCILEEAAASSHNVKKTSAPIRESEVAVSEVKEPGHSIEQEIECPRSHDIMTSCSEFDRLGYFCDESSFSLHLSH